MNLGNAVEALCGPLDRGNPVVEAARQEGIACLHASGLAYASDDEPPVHREKALKLQPIGTEQRPGGSTWQSLARRAPTTEVDYLNGEIVLLGRAHGIRTPVNEALQLLMRKAARDGSAPGNMTLEQLSDEIQKS